MLRNAAPLFCQISEGVSAKSLLSVGIGFGELRGTDLGWSLCPCRKAAASRSQTRFYNPSIRVRKEMRTFHDVKDVAFPNQTVEVVDTVPPELVVVKVYPIPDF